MLGRHVVVDAGETAPADWDGALRLVIDARVLAAPADALEQLRAHHLARRSVVIELHADFDEPPRSAESRPPYELGPGFGFPLDELHHLVWCNSVDARRGALRWALLDAAAALGARPGGPADVLLADGSPAWLDGGPVRHTAAIDGVAVVPAVSVEHGVLAPLGPNDPPSSPLAPDQLAAVTHGGGAARIIAPAGSGKTRVLTERARHLLTRWNLPPAALSLVAFNRRAQQEMAERTPDLPRLQVRTLNAMALALVNGTPPFARTARTWQTIDEGEVRRILGRLVATQARRNQDPLAPWIEALSMVRLGLVPPDQVEERYDGDVTGFAEVWPRYRRELDRAGLVDFDDQIYRALELLLADPVAREAAQRASRVLLVDEFQDLTPAHLLLVRLLAAPGGAVFAVGDDDQTIYGYNGADPAWLVDFDRYFPGAGHHPLKVNYRCPGGIVTGVDRLLRRNRVRVAKTIRSATPEADGLVVSDAADTVAATVAVVSRALDAGTAAGDIAVLTRVNALLAPVQAALVDAGVDVTGGAGADFTSHTAVRAALAWLRLAASDGAFDPADLDEAIKRPSRPLHPNVATWVSEQRSADQLRRLAGRLQRERDSERVESFAADIDRLGRLVRSGTPTESVLTTLIDDIGLGGAVATLDHTRHGMNRTAQSDDLTALVQLGRLHPDVATFESWLRHVLRPPGQAAGVVLSSVHRVKGQEWPVVVVHHAAADQYPHRLADDVEEERRIFHVAVTRAARQVVITGGAAPSPFVAELSTEPGPDQPAGPPARTPARAMARSSASNAPSARGPLADSTTVLAAPGLVLVDQGRPWEVVAVHDDHVEARQGTARRRFSLGGTVTTEGRQRGTLVAPPPSVSDPASVRAFDLLRQRREVLRAGKPAYVVFDDATLERIALALPASLDDLARVKGVGPAKLEAYGDDVLLAVEDARKEPGGA